VEANTASGTVSSAFEDLRVTGQWGAKRITGRLGAGNGRLKATTVSGSIALLRRPPVEDTPWEPELEDTGPAGGTQGDSGDNSASGRNDGVTDAPADGTTDKKVL
jgi:hypothetical protein